MTALQSMQAGKSGGVGIVMSDFMKIKRMLESGQIRNAENWLVFAEEKERKRQQEIQRENMRLNQEGQLAAQQAKTEGDMGKIAAQGEVDAGLKEIDGANQIAKEALKQASATAPV